MTDSMLLALSGPKRALSTGDGYVARIESWVMTTPVLELVDQRRALARLTYSEGGSPGASRLLATYAVPWVCGLNTYDQPLLVLSRICSGCRRGRSRSGCRRVWAWRAARLRQWSRPRPGRRSGRPATSRPCGRPGLVRGLLGRSDRGQAARPSAEARPQRSTVRRDGRPRAAGSRIAVTLARKVPFGCRSTRHIPGHALEQRRGSCGRLSPLQTTYWSGRTRISLAA